MLSDKDLAELARACYEECRIRPTPITTAEGARAALGRLAGDPGVRARHVHAVRLIRRALAVNLEIPANRKGGIPRALGLTSRSRERVSIEHSAICLMAARVSNVWEEDPTLGGPVLPYRAHQDAAQAVVDGFYYAKINSHLTVENVLEILRRDLRAHRARAREVALDRIHRAAPLHKTRQ